MTVRIGLGIAAGSYIVGTARRGPQYAVWFPYQQQTSGRTDGSARPRIGSRRGFAEAPWCCHKALAYSLRRAGVKAFGRKGRSCWGTAADRPGGSGDVPATSVTCDANFLRAWSFTCVDAGNSLRSTELSI